MELEEWTSIVANHCGFRFSTSLQSAEALNSRDITEYSPEGRTQLAWLVLCCSTGSGEFSRFEVLELLLLGICQALN